MADGCLLLIFRGYTTDQLLALQSKLQANLLAAGTYSSQTIGAKSYTRDLRYLTDQLCAVQFVLNERTTPYEGTVITDFSSIETGGARGQPAGVTDDLSY